MRSREGAMITRGSVMSSCFSSRLCLVGFHFFWRANLAMSTLSFLYSLYSFIKKDLLCPCYEIDPVCELNKENKQHKI